MARQKKLPYEYQYNPKSQSKQENQSTEHNIKKLSPYRKDFNCVANHCIIILGLALFPGTKLAKSKAIFSFLGEIFFWGQDFFPLDEITTCNIDERVSSFDLWFVFLAPGVRPQGLDFTFGSESDGGFDFTFNAPSKPEPEISEALCES